MKINLNKSNNVVGRHGYYSDCKSVNLTATHNMVRLSFNNDKDKPVKSGFILSKEDMKQICIDYLLSEYHERNSGKTFI